MNKSTFKKIVACTSICGMLSNFYPLNAQHEASEGNNIKTAPGIAKDPTFKYPTQQIACTDAVLISWIKLCKDEKFEIRFKDGSKSKGKILFENDQCFLIKKTSKKEIKEELEKISWENVHSVKISRDRSNLYLIYAITFGSIVFFLSSAAAQ